MSKSSYQRSYRTYPRVYHSGTICNSIIQDMRINTRKCIKSDKKQRFIAIKLKLQKERGEELF